MRDNLLPSPLAGGGSGSDTVAVNRGLPEGLHESFQALRSQAASTERQSLDYEHDMDQRSRYAATFKRRKCWGYSGASLGRWSLSVLLGLLMGALAFVLAAIVEEIQLWKLWLWLKCSIINMLLSGC